jgi:hypothetical protein
LFIYQVLIVCEALYKELWRIHKKTLSFRILTALSFTTMMLENQPAAGVQMKGRSFEGEVRTTEVGCKGCVGFQPDREVSGGGGPCCAGH